MKQEYTACRVCGNKSNKFTSGKLLDYAVDYFECPVCGYVQTEEPYWLDKAYSEAINLSDTGILTRNVLNLKVTIVTLLLLGGINKKVIDTAGGYGILVRLLRDYGIDAYWSDKYCSNLVSKGFEYEDQEGFLVTSFEAFEHFVNPPLELDNLCEIAPNILLSTFLIPNPTPELDSWWYYGLEHGQHIGFYRFKTLEKMAKERGKYFITNGSNYHLITEKPINENIWKAMMKTKSFFMLLTRLMCSSKTWSDHLYVKGDKN